MGGQLDFRSSLGEVDGAEAGGALTNNEPRFSVPPLKDVVLHPSVHSDEEDGRHVGSHGGGCVTKKHQRVVCPVYRPTEES